MFKRKKAPVRIYVDPRFKKILKRIAVEKETSVINLTGQIAVKKSKGLFDDFSF